MKRESSRAVIIDNNRVLTMFRRKIDEVGNKNEYYAIPGGGIEESETMEKAVVRELQEELNVKIKILGYLGKVEKAKDIENYFHCEIIEGTPRLGGEELEIMTDSNYYEPMYMDINELKNKNFQRMDVVNKALNKKYE